MCWDLRLWNYRDCEVVWVYKYVPRMETMNSQNREAVQVVIVTAVAWRQ